MTRKIYRTAQGKTVDLGALILQNENVRAVGNMKVNARGDLVDSNNRPIDTRNQQVSRQYDRQTTNVKDDAVYSSAQHAESRGTKKPEVKRAPARPAPSVAVEVPAAPEDFDDDFVRQPAPVAAQEPAAEAAADPAAGGGLAAAIAKARQIKQEPLKTPRQIAQEQEGVRKL